MTYSVVFPSATLTGIVRHYWFIEQQDKPDTLWEYHLMPEGFMDLVFQYADSFQNSATPSRHFNRVVLTGHSDISKTVFTRGDFKMCGVAFYPSALPLLFGVEARQVFNRILDFRDVITMPLDALEEKIWKAGDDLAKVIVFEAFLLTRLHAGRQRHSLASVAQQLIVKNQGLINIRELSGELNISTRQFERKFLEAVGLSPKRYSRLIRFQATLSHISKSITDVAYSYGYADQAHFIREFREFSGLSPKQYFKGTLDAAENFIGVRKAI